MVVRAILSSPLVDGRVTSHPHDHMEGDLPRASRRVASYRQRSGLWHGPPRSVQ